MIRVRTKTTELTSMKGKSSAAKDGGEDKLEVRPGGMLVQKREPDEAQTRIPPPTIRVRVKFGSIYHEIIIDSTATFGELKKKLTAPTGLHHEDQKLIYKDKERASKTFLDVVGVKDKSKMVLTEDLISRERRLIEARKTAKIEKAAKLITEISLEVDRIAGQVSSLESVVSKGGKVAEKTVSNLIDLLMNQLLKLDEMKLDGDINQKKKMQVERVQKFVEKLDLLTVKIKATQPKPLNQERNGGNTAANYQQSRRSGGKFPPIAVATQQKEASSKNNLRQSVVTTHWETFDSLPTIFETPPVISTSTSTTSKTIQHDFNWDLLLK